jgi:hypothetical protein
MSDVHIDTCGTTAFGNDLCNSDVHGTSISPSECHDEIKAPLSLSFSDDWARMSSNSNVQDLPLRSSSEDMGGPLSPSSSGRYVHENLSDPLGRLHRNIKYQDPLDACHWRKGEYSKRDLQPHVPRYMPELPEMPRNPYALFTGPELSPEIPRAVDSLDLQCKEASSGHETTKVHGEDVSTNSPIPKLEVRFLHIRD